VVGVSRPAVTQNIKELSKQLGVCLFHPHRKGVEPSSDAIAIYPTIKMVVDSLIEAEESVQVFNEESSAVIKIICTTNFAGYYLNEHIVNFSDKFPNIRFDIQNKSVDDALVALEKNKTHMVFSIIPSSKLSSLDFNHIEIERFPQSFFTTKTFAKKYNIGKSITEKEFDELKFIAIRTVHNYFDMIKSPEIFVDTQEMLLRLISKDIGVGFGIWEVARDVMGKEIAFQFNIDNKKPDDVVLICLHPPKQSITKAASTFVDLIKKGC